MAKFETLEPGQIALVQQTKEGRILQIGLTTTQSEMLQNFLAILSKESPLVQMGKDWDLVLKSSSPKRSTPEIVCYCGSLRVALETFKKAEYEAVLKGEIALLPCCMFVDIEREYGAESDYKAKADDLHKRKIDIADRVFILNVGGYIGQSTRSEINYALAIGKPVEYLEAV